MGRTETSVTQSEAAVPTVWHCDSLLFLANGSGRGRHIQLGGKSIGESPALLALLRSFRTPSSTRLREHVTQELCQCTQALKSSELKRECSSNLPLCCTKKQTAREDISYVRNPLGPPFCSWDLFLILKFMNKSNKLKSSHDADARLIQSGDTNLHFLVPCPHPGFSTFSISFSGF